MSWVDKAHRKHKVDKLVKEVLSNPEYKKMQQQEDLKCFSCLGINLRGFYDEKAWVRKEADPGVCGIPEKAAEVCDGR